LAADWPRAGSPIGSATRRFMLNAFVHQTGVPKRAATPRRRSQLASSRNLPQPALKHVL
jgi:hypothetical protein